MILSLNNLNKECGSVFQGFSKKLQEVALIVIITKNLKFFQHINIFSDLHFHIGKVFSNIIVVCFRNGQENKSSFSKVSHGGDDILSLDSNMLNSGAIIIVHKFLNLTFAFSNSGFIARHFDIFIKIGHNH